MYIKTLQKILSILALLLVCGSIINGISNVFITGTAVFSSIDWSILFLSITIIIGLFSKKK